MEDLLTASRAKAVAIYAVIGAATGALFAFCQPAGAGVIVTIVGGTWATGWILEKQRGGRPEEPIDPVEQIHTLRLALEDAAHRQGHPAYREAAGFLDMAQESLRSTAP